MTIVLKALVSLLLLAAVVFEAYERLILGVPWLSFTPASNGVVWLLAPLWLAGIAGLWIRPVTGRIATGFALLIATVHFAIVGSTGMIAGHLFLGAMLVADVLAVVTALKDWPGVRYVRPHREKKRAA